MICEQCVRDVEFVCKFIADVHACGALDVDFLMVESISCWRVVSVEKKEESCFGIQVYIWSSSSLVISVSLSKRDCW